MIPIKVKKMPQVRLVFDRKHQATKSDLRGRKKGLVQVEVLHDGRRRFFSTGVKVYLDQWDDVRRVVNCSESALLNATLNDIVDSLTEQASEMVRSGSFDLDAIGVRSTADSPLLSEWIVLCAEKMEIAANTRKAYGALSRSVERSRCFGCLEDVNARQINAYDAFLVSSGASNNTRRVYHSKLHKLLLGAIKMRFLENDPYVNFEMPKLKKTDREYLTEEELLRVRDTPLSKRLERYRDLFLFQCYTGLSYIDTQSLDASMLQHENGSVYIVRRRQKTHVRYRVKLLKPAIAILEKYDWHLPQVPAPHYDRCLLSIAKDCGIAKRMSSHVGRHTFATWALSHGTQIEIVSKMLGHTNINTTQVYAKIMAKDVDAAFDKLEEFV